MKEPARDIKNYRTDLSAALEDTFQRRALDKFAVDYRASRERIYSRSERPRADRRSRRP